MTGPVVRLATRGSPQARAQAEVVAGALRERVVGCTVELVLVETTGDQRQDVPLHVIGGQGVFVKEVQQAVLDGRADGAVHSAKDLPSTTMPELVIAAFTARRDAADALVGRSLDDLTHGATVATGSVRRRGQLAAHRADLHFVELRGNIASRLSKVPPDGSIVMAVAALQVLGETRLIAQRLDPTVFVPAVGQGCVAIECRRGDERIAELIGALDHAPTSRAVTIERSFLAELGSGCSLPVGGYVDGPLLHVFLASTDRPDAPAGEVQVVTDHVPLAGDDGDHELARAAAHRALATVGGR